ncbi:MAG TPA: hypothetical protein VM511_12765 [Luteolibacter sp.]|nr:hypothetical protein [Luteolibacter sp.]
MKFLKNAAFGAMALASAGSAYAQTTIHFAASNGDRNATQTAIGKLLTDWKYTGLSGTISGSAGAITTSGGVASTYTGSNFGTWRGKYLGNNVIIRTNYAGALAGIAAVAGGTLQKFDTSTGSEADGTGAASKILNPLDTPNFVTSTVDFGFSTNFQSTSPFLGPYKGTTYATVREHNVGISPLGFYASPGFPATNITTQQAQLLYKTGVQPLALFTGDWVNHKNITVWAIGRNTDAGQRYGAYAEVGLGTSQVVRAWQPTVSGAIAEATHGIIGIGPIGGTVDSHALWPAEEFSGIASEIGNGGFNSGANLAAALTVTLSANAYKGRYYNPDGGEDGTGAFENLYDNATAGYYIGYLTPGDANPRVLGVNSSGVDNQPTRPAGTRGVALKYNGVALTTDNVKNGQYTAWLYNRLLTPTSWPLVGSNTTQTFAYALRDQIKNVDAPAGGGIIDDATVKVRRLADGGLVIEK